MPTVGSFGLVAQVTRVFARRLRCFALFRFFLLAVQL
jgi:hypothetical protein